MTCRTKLGNRLLSAALLTAALARTPGAEAAPDTRPPATTAAVDRARAKFQGGLALEAAGDWAGALSLFEEVAQVRLTPQVRFHIGYCEEHLGRLAAALGDYEIAAHEAEAAKVVEVSNQVASRRDELRARIPKIVIQRGPGAGYATISLDGVALGSSSIGVELPVDPGPHGLEARASGYKPFTKTVEMTERSVTKVEVTLERVPAVAETPAERPAAGASVDKVAASTSPNLVPYIVGGAGVATLGASAIFFALRQSVISDLDEQCVLPPGRTCPASAEPKVDQGKTYNLLANVTLGVGIAAVGAGAVLLLTQKPAATTSGGGVRVAPMADRASLGLTVYGAM